MHLNLESPIAMSNQLLKSSKHLPFWLLTLAVFIGLPGFTLIQDGMFMDAMLYTSVAHNEAHGIGSFWFPQFSKLNLALSDVNSFHEQPPLAFGIESVFFRIFGDSMYVERFYVFFCACLTAYFIHYLWKLIFKNRPDLQKFSWLPIFLWITIPTIFWAASNNVNENTMGLFIIGAVIFCYRAFVDENGHLWKIALAGLMIFLATLAKGFPGFFPLCVPFVYWLSTRKISFKRAVLYSLILLAVPLVIYTILFQIQVSHDSLSVYLFKRAFVRISSAPTTDNRFHSLSCLLQDLLPMLGIVVVLFAIARWKKVKYEWLVSPRMVVFFVLVGLAGSAPLMLTMVQKAFYLTPCFPYFAIAGAALILPLLIYFYKSLNVDLPLFKIFRGVSAMLLVIAIGIVVFMKGKAGRDQALLHDVKIVSTLIPQHGDVEISNQAFNLDWEVQCYLMRYYYISCDFHPASGIQYFLIDKNEAPDRDLSNYDKVEMGLEKYDLYKIRP